MRRSGLLSPRTATALGVLVLVLAIALLTLKGFDHQLTGSGTWSSIAIVVTYAGVGLVVARRQPHNPIGWLLLIFIALYLLSAGAVEYAVLAYGLGHRGLPLAPAAVVLDTLQAPSLAVFAPVILLFPDGRLASRRWRRVLWVYAVLTAYVSAVSVAQGVAAVAGHDIHLGTSGNLTSTGQLGGWLANPPTWLAFPVLASIAAIGLSFVAHQVLSWRRAGGERRQQLKWLASGAAVAVFSILLGCCWPPSYFTSTRQWPWPHQPWPRRPCSTRCGCGCSTWWTAGSTAPATTPTRPRPRWQHGSKTP